MKNKSLLLKFFTLIIVAFCSHSTFANGIDKLMKYAAPSGSMSNVNKAAIINDQQGGYS